MGKPLRLSGLRYVYIFSSLILLLAVVVWPRSLDARTVFTSGEVVITELFSGTSDDIGPLFYLELYNTTAQPVAFQEITIRVNNEQILIQQPLTIAPNQIALISNRRFETSGSIHGLVVEEFHLPGSGGEIELILNGDRIWLSRYNELPSNHALELIHVADVMDGIATSDAYRPSTESFATGRFGSPGAPGATIRVFSHEAQGSGWHMASPPGYLLSRVDREQMYWNLQSRSGGNDKIPSPGSGILHYVSDGEPMRWVATEPERDSHVELDLTHLEESWVLAGNPFEVPFPIERLESEGGELQNRSIQIWNGLEKTFQVLEPEGELKPWQAAVLKNFDATSLIFHRPPEEAVNEPEDVEHRSIRFELRHRDLTDRAAVLYFHEEASHGSDLFDADKLLPLFKNSEEARASLLFFLAERDGSAAYLARDARPYPAEAPFEIRMGHVALQTSGLHTLSWEGLEQLPDHWNLRLTDILTGISIDMKQENEFNFDVTATPLELPELSEEPSIHPLQLSSPADRFLLSVEPLTMNSPAVVEEGDTDRVELRPNYPNPFNTVTTIVFDLPEAMSVVVNVYNIVGQRVAQLLEGEGQQGRNELLWEASEMPSGIYIVRLETASTVLTRKMTLVR